MYIVKVYEDGELRGYLPKDPNASEPTFNKKAARLFNDRKEAVKEVKENWDEHIYGFDKIVMVKVYNNIKDMPLPAQIEEYIFDWVKRNYGESEVENLSWDVEGLSKYLAKRLK